MDNFNYLKQNDLSVNECLNMICLLEEEYQSIKRNMENMSQLIATHKPSFWDNISFLLKNKLGMTKDEAQKLFYDYHSKGKQEGGEDPKQPESVEEKMNMIMGYMKDTSEKLESIEKDIVYLKQQVETILKKI